MAKKGNSVKQSSSAATTTTTNLPGLRGVKVIVSQPSLVKENSSKIIKK